MATDDQAVRAAAFLARHHRPEALVLANVWDGGSARILEQVGFEALATTSAGISFAAGVPDGTLDRDAMLAAVAQIVAVVDCPVTADLESGYGSGPAEVAATVAAAVALGVVGSNIEDSAPGAGSLFGVEEAAERLAAARAVAPTGTFVLNARVDTYLVGTAGGSDEERYAATLERAARYVAAGADCIFVPGVTDPDVIRRLAGAIGAPLNVVAGLTSPVLDVATLQSLGVSRITIGGSLTRAVLGFVERAGRELLDDGTFGFVDRAIPFGDVQRRFAD
jgi:2-methylisocitrate lyase-like PEP mutase family enzyme